VALRPVRSVFLRAEARRDPVYVIPPRKALRTMDGYLDLSDLPEDPTRRHVAVDLFFRTLADTHGSHAVAVVLSGLDSDGASAIKRINERGGLTIAQDPESEHSGMPRAAIATGMIDGVWPLRDIPGGCSTRGRRGIFTRRRVLPRLRAPPARRDRHTCGRRSARDDRGRACRRPWRSPSASRRRDTDRRSSACR